MKICDLIKATHKTELELALIRLQVKKIMYKKALKKKLVKVAIQ